MKHVLLVLLAATIVFSSLGIAGSGRGKQPSPATAGSTQLSSGAATHLLQGLNATTAPPTVPQLMSHQGYVADSLGDGITGTLPMTFRMYDDSLAGSLVLTQSFPSIALTKGIFNVNLDVASISFTSQYWLETEVNGQTLAPRTRLTSAPYSLAPWRTNGPSIYYSGGPVGIGTSTPEWYVLLDARSSASTAALRLENTDQGSEILLAPPGSLGTGGVGTGTNHDFPIFTNNSDRITVKNDGKVGVGTTSPSNLLTVAGNADFTGNVGIGTNAPARKLEVQVGGAQDGIDINGTGRTEFRLGNTSANFANMIYFPDDSTLRLGTTDGFDVMSIKKGKVGIGTTTPQTKFSIIGATMQFEPTNYSNIYAVGGSTRLYIGKTVSTNNASIILRTGGAARGEIGLTADDKIHIKTASGVAGSETYTDRLVIDTSGNVGIGTDIPGSKLSVSGGADISAGLSVGANIGAGGAVHATGFRGKNESGTMSYYDVSFYVPPGIGSGAQLILGGGLNLGYISTFTPSDRRLKEQINPMEGEALERIMSLKPVSFEFKHIAGLAYDQLNPGAQEGFIADELQEIIPSAVKGDKDAVTEDGKIQPQSVSPMPIIAVLTKAIQEQQKQIEELKALVKSLAAEKKGTDSKSMGELK